MQKVTVLGTGVLGSQIIFQSAYFGKDVVAYDINDEALSRLPARWEQLKAAYAKDLPDATPEKLDEAVSRIRATSDLGDAVADADIVIEAVPELLKIKQETWNKVSENAREDAVLCTNSSTLLPSDMAPFVDHPERFLALHFANEIWKFNTGEVMGHPGTDPKNFEAVAQFAEEIGMVPIRVLKEQPGYLLNSLLVPLLNAAGDLLANGVASPQDIDNTWKIATGAPAGPFEIFDVIGMMTPYNLCKDSTDPLQQKFAEILKRDYIDKGRLGKISGHGFYDYE